VIATLLALRFAQPFVLLALALLPLLWWLLRVTPPAPRRQEFPAIRLLRGLAAKAETAARTPLWLLALRLLAATLAILALAQPLLRHGAGLAGEGPLLLVIDDGWASAPDWAARQAAAMTALDRAAAAGRDAALLTTAPGEDGSKPALTATMQVPELRPRVAALRPKPWSTDRDAAAALLRTAKAGSVVYLGDDVGRNDGFATALAAFGEVAEFRAAASPLMLAAPGNGAAGLTAHLLAVPQATPRDVAVLAQSADGRSQARAVLHVDAGADHAEGALTLPLELRNTLGRLVLDGVSSSGAIWLLDETSRRRPVGLLNSGGTGDAPLTGALYYVRRALSPFAELREGDLRTLLAREISVLVLADTPVADPDDAALLTAWVEKGGTLIRFAGPSLAAHPDALLPVGLLQTDRQLGGAMSWARPPGLAAFAQDTPFAGLAVPTDVRVTRQVLASPASVLSGGQVWARLEDGTPLITEAPRGAGRIVLFHVTANADWSDLPLSGLFIDLLRRLVGLAHGVAAEAGGETAPLPPAETLDGFGQLGPPPAAALALPESALATTPASPRHPPGFYGHDATRRARNLGATITHLDAAPPIPGASEAVLGEQGEDQPISPWLMAAALALLASDMIVSLRLRGLWPAALVVLALAGAPPAFAQSGAESPALATHLAYIVTGDDARDEVSRAGLQGLADYVNRRTNAAIGTPAPVRPGQDDLSFYPLLYWPIGAEDATPSAEQARALDDYMAHGGIILIDTRNAGSGEGFAPGTGAALARIGAVLAIPPLAPLTDAHVLAHTFYLLHDFPGRYDGGTVWVQRDEDRANDSVSPAIIGGNDWAAAWAVDASGRNPFATISGGLRQRVLAYRFGVNLVMYALTGNYKGDQVHVPALLERLGQ
jgi:hypothetical protein